MKSLAFILSISAILSLSFMLPDKGEITLTCKVASCEKVDSLYLYEFNGVLFKKINAAPTEDYERYQFIMPATGPRFYYVGLDGNNIRPVILGTESAIELKGSCNQFQSANLTNSELNKDYLALKNTMNQDKANFGQLLRQLQNAQRGNNVDAANMTIRQLGDLDRKRLALIDSLKKVNPYLSKVAALNTYLSYQNHGTGDLSEMEYFATNYFSLVDWSDPDYHYMPWVYEGFKSWVQTLTAIGLTPDQQQKYIDDQLDKIPSGSRTYMLALGGVMAGLQQRKSPLMSHYAKQYAGKYRATEPEAVARIDELLKMSRSFTMGAEAPDFTMNTPEGTPLSLSELRGKVLLVDFWASWCGPCRRENPNVVAAYQKYHDKGFDVLGVSLDKTKDRWVQAIEKDGLLWHHVSDLKGWKNEAAQLYGVSSIPATVLLDQEGRIIARNLRGEALEAKLAEIFGE